MVTLPDWAVGKQDGPRLICDGDHSGEYGAAALDDECRKIANSLNGTRNDTLNKATFALSQLVAGGELSESEVRTRLHGAAVACGLQDDEITATIESGFGGGIKTPRTRLGGHMKPETEKLVEMRASPFVWTDPALIPPREWVYGHHLIRKFVSVTVAPGGVGKSSLLIIEALALATGKPLLDQTVRTPVRVWLWNLEDPIDELQRRLQAACQHYGLTANDISNRLFVDSGRQIELCTAEMGSNGAIIRRPVVDALIKEMQDKQIDVLIVDPFVSSHAVSENDNPAMDLVAKEWGRIADATNSAIELVHHTRKLSGESEVTTESSRGGKALTDAARDVRAINRMTADEAVKAGVDNHRLYFRAYSDKCNLSPPADKSEWFRLENVELANGDQIGVVTPWVWPDLFADLTNDSLKDVQIAIHDKQYRENAQAENWAGHAIAGVLGLDINNKHDKEKIKAFIKLWVQNGALKVVKIKDDRSKKRPVLEVGEWSI